MLEGRQRTAIKTILTEPKNTEIKICSKHGNQMDKVGTGKYQLYQCLHCNEEKKERQKKDEEDRVRMESNKAQAKALEESNVPERYRCFKEFKGSVQADAYAKVEQFFSPGGTYGALLLGHVGTGKTQMACQLMSQWITKQVMADGKASGLYTTLFDIILAIKDSWQAGVSTFDVMGSFIAPDILIIDEVDTCYRSDTECLYASRIIDKRYAALKKTVVIGNVSIKEVASIIGEKAVSRLLQGTEPIVFNWESYRSKDAKEKV